MRTQLRGEGPVLGSSPAGLAFVQPFAHNLFVWFGKVF